MKKDKTKIIVGTAIFMAICVVLTLISNYIPIGGLTINLALIAIAASAIVYGPVSGLVVGLVNGGLVMLTAAPFFAINPFATVLTCLLKSGIAGLVCGLIYRLFVNKNKVFAAIFATLLVPIINTGLFVIFALLFFLELFGDTTAVISLFIAVNFIIEFAVCLAVSPSVVVIIDAISKRHHGVN